MTVEIHVRCPHCGKLNDLASGLNGARRPDAGSVSLCMTCGEWAVFENDFIGLRLRVPTEDEWASMQRDETVQKTISAWNAVQRGSTYR